MKVALAQMKVLQGDIEGNIAKIRRFIGLARRKHADVIVFPEYCLTGSIRGRPDLVDHKKRYRKLFSDLAKKNRIDIVAGSFVEGYGGKLYNTSCYFDRDGGCLGAYRKVNLWHSERDRIDRGDSIEIFKTRFGKASIALCWDLSDPVLFREIARKGADLIFVPSFWSDAGISNREIESRNIDALCHSRAFETESVLIYVNAAGKYSENDSLIGHSQLVLPIRGAIRKLAHNRESLAVIEVPFDLLRRAANVYKIRRDILGR